MDPHFAKFDAERTGASTPLPADLRPARRFIPAPDGIPIKSLLAAGLFSFTFLATASWTVYPVLALFLSDNGGLGPLLLPTISDSVLVEALIGAAALTIISATIALAERHRRIPEWVPYVASFPVAWGLILPSALEYGGTLPVWFIFASAAAAIFCIHWRIFTWSQSICD
jgi:hypothetical protein